MPYDLNRLSRSLKESTVFAENKNQKNILSMNVDEISGVLRQIESILHGYIEYLNNHEDIQEENKIKLSNDLFFQHFLSELSENFFPMAHTQAPLSDLKIVRTSIAERELANVMQGLGELENASQILESSLSIYKSVKINFEQTVIEARDRINANR